MKNKVAIVYSDYYKDVTSGLLDGSIIQLIQLLNVMNLR